jgi:hypothetical protein
MTAPRRYKTVASALVRTAMGPALSAGMSEEELSSSFAITRDEVMSPRGRVPWPKWLRVLEALQRVERVPTARSETGPVAWLRANASHLATFRRCFGRLRG